MKKNFIVETHDTPFGSYTLDFVDNKGRLFNERVLKNMKVLEEEERLGDYYFLSKSGWFNLVPYDGSVNTMDEIITIETAEKKSHTASEHSEEDFLKLMDGMKQGDSLFEGYFYNKEKCDGCLMFNLSTARFDFYGSVMNIFWKPDNLYSIGIFKETMEEERKKAGMEDRLEFEFHDNGEIIICTVCFYDD